MVRNVENHRVRQVGSLIGEVEGRIDSSTQTRVVLTIKYGLVRPTTSEPKVARKIEELGNGG